MLNQINSTVRWNTDTLWPTQKNKYKLNLTSAEWAQLCFLWGLCVQFFCYCVFINFSFSSPSSSSSSCFIYMFCVTFFLLVTFLLLCFSVFKSVCVCVCSTVCACLSPEEELSGYSSLRRCLYGGIVDNKSWQQPAAEGFKWYLDSEEFVGFYIFFTSLVTWLWEKFTLFHKIIINIICAVSWLINYNGNYFGHS